MSDREELGLIMARLSGDNEASEGYMRRADRVLDSDWFKHRIGKLEAANTMLRNTTDWQAEKLRDLRTSLTDIDSIAQGVINGSSTDALGNARHIQHHVTAALEVSRMRTTNEMRAWAANEAQQRAEASARGRGNPPEPDLSDPMVVQAIFDDATTVVRAERTRRRIRDARRSHEERKARKKR